MDRQLLNHPAGRAFAMACLRRHAGGDWGDLGDHDAEANDLALVTGARILSSYRIPEPRYGNSDDGTGVTGSGASRGGDERLWIITESEDSQGVRSQTTLLFPSDY